MTTGYQDSVPLPLGARPVSTLQMARRLAGQAYRDLLHAGRRRRRTSKVSLAEYEGRWASQLAHARWARADSLDAAVRASSYGSGDLVCLVRGRVMSMPAEEYFAWRAEVLASLMLDRHDPETPISEVGCGVGKNLLVLARAGFRDLQGLEPTASGREAARQLSSHFDLGLDVRPFNLLEGDVTVLRDRVVLTNHVIEQLPRDVERSIRNLVRARPSEVMHIEPCWENLSRRSLVDWATRWHAWAWDYQRELLRVLARLEGEGLLDLVEVARLGYSPRLRSDPTLVRWRVTR